MRLVRDLVRDVVLSMLEDLPIDLLPDILCHLARPEHLSVCTLVNRTFNQCATRELYKRVALFPWQRFVIPFLYG